MELVHGLARRQEVGNTAPAGNGLAGWMAGAMERAQGLARRQDLERTTPAAQGLAGWVSGALRAVAGVRLRELQATRVEQHMELVETLSLGGKRQVMLIDCEGERYLVGCGQDSVATIEKVAPDTRRNVKTVAQAWL